MPHHDPLDSGNVSQGPDDDQEESNYDKYDKYDKYEVEGDCRYEEGECGDDDKFDDEDSLLDEMLQKAELLRLAMLAASSCSNQTQSKTQHKNASTGTSLNKISRPMPPSSPNEDQTPDLRMDMQMDKDINRNRPMKSVQPTIPETIETADHLTDCSSVGYYSIVFGSGSTNAKANNQIKNFAPKTRQWLREQSTSHTGKAYARLPVDVDVDEQVLEEGEEEEKTNEDGSIHHAFSDDGSSCRRRRSLPVPPIATSWSMSSNNEMLSPLAISPPNDDEIVSVADYLRTKTDQSNGGDSLLWVKVDFVNLSDDDYAPLQDYSRTIYNELGPSNPEIEFRRRKRRRKILTFGLCCVVLGFFWIRLSNKRNTTALAVQKVIDEPVIPAKLNMKEVPVAVVKEKAKAIVADTSLSVMSTLPIKPRQNSLSLTKETTAGKTKHNGNAVTTITILVQANEMDHEPKSKPIGGFFKAILTPGRVETRMIWENTVIDRRQILESFFQSLVQ